MFSILTGMPFLYTMPSSFALSYVTLGQAVEPNVLQTTGEHGLCCQALQLAPFAHAGLCAKQLQLYCTSCNLGRHHILAVRHGDAAPCNILGKGSECYAVGLPQHMVGSFICPVCDVAGG